MWFLISFPPFICYLSSFLCSSCKEFSRCADVCLAFPVLFEKFFRGEKTKGAWPESEMAVEMEMEMEMEMDMQM